MQSIERKFLVKRLPDLSKLTPIHYERYILLIKSGKERRIQHIGSKYELEEVEVIKTGSVLSRNIIKKSISLKEFEALRKHAIGNISRESYLISQNPNFTLKIYDGNYIGLTRAELKFESQEEAESYKPLDWFGDEITNSPLGRDAELIKLSEEEFRSLLKSFSK